MSTSEHFLDFIDAAHQSVNFLVSIIASQSGAGGGGDAEAVHQGLGAVMAGADGDSFLVEHGADVVRVDAVEHERDGPGALFGSADQANAGDSRQPLGCIREE